MTEMVMVSTRKLRTSRDVMSKNVGTNCNCYLLNGLYFPVPCNKSNVKFQNSVTE